MRGGLLGTADDILVHRTGNALQAARVGFWLEADRIRWIELRARKCTCSGRVCRLGFKCVRAGMAAFRLLRAHNWRD